MLPTGLIDKRILVTRAKAYYPAMCRIVESRGASAVSLPCLAVEYLPDMITNAMTLLDTCSDILFTSANGVRAVAKTMADDGRSLAEAVQNKRVAAVGKKTARALSQSGVCIDIIPEKPSQDGLVDAYLANGLPNSLLFFRAEEGRETLAEAMSKQGVKIVTVPAYRTIFPSDDASDVIAMLQNGHIDAVLLGSAKTASFYLQRIGSLTLANRPVIAVISEKMAIATRKLGLNVQVVAKDASFEAMLDALARHFDQHA
ncbi:MAG: uroporphyrinogen-III synthase [Mariprofundus sp.]|nr:uroporphyrinogen-III synthase [Mariprofundus sp.]